jgi:hypothetical protein
MLVQSQKMRARFLAREEKRGSRNDKGLKVYKGLRAFAIIEFLKSFSGGKSSWQKKRRERERGHAAMKISRWI